MGLDRGLPAGSEKFSRIDDKLTAEVWDRLGGELVVDPGKLLAAGWKPAVETHAGLAAMAQAASPRKSGTASRSTP